MRQEEVHRFHTGPAEAPRDVKGPYLQWQKDEANKVLYSIGLQTLPEGSCSLFFCSRSHGLSWLVRRLKDKERDSTSCCCLRRLLEDRLSLRTGPGMKNSQMEQQKIAQTLPHITNAINPTKNNHNP